MTFTIQEVPERDLTAEGLQMYDFTLNDILAEQVDHCMSIGLMGHEEIKIEDPFNNNIINNLPTKYQVGPTKIHLLLFGDEHFFRLNFLVGP